PPVYLHPILGNVTLEELPGSCNEISGAAAGSGGGAIVCNWQLKPSIPLAGQEIVIDGLSGTSTDALVRVNLAGRASVTQVLKPAEPAWKIDRDAATGSAVSAAGFFRMGVEHILYGIDHLLFVLLLLLIVARRWMLVKTVTAFTVAHTITLGAAV